MQLLLSRSVSYEIIIIIGIQPLGRFGQRPELSQSTGIALVRCILGKFLGVVCHCFPPLMKLYSQNASRSCKTIKHNKQNKTKLNIGY